MRNSSANKQVCGWGPSHDGGCGRSHRSSRGFTLIEILIVVMILAILAAIVIPRFQNNTGEAEVAALQSNLRAMRVMLEQYHAMHGDWPTKIDPAWFAGGLPDHPGNTYDVPAVEVESKPARTDPSTKTLSATVGGAYWYNPGNGIIRARIPRQATNAETNALYAEVNAN